MTPGQLTVTLLGFTVASRLESACPGCGWNPDAAGWSPSRPEGQGSARITADVVPEPGHRLPSRRQSAQLTRRGPRHTDWFTRGAQPWAGGWWTAGRSAFIRSRPAGRRRPPERRLRRRRLEHPEGDVEDAAGPGLRAGEREAVPLVLDLDDAAGVHQVVGGVEDAALAQLLGDSGWPAGCSRRRRRSAAGQHRRRSRRPARRRARTARRRRAASREQLGGVGRRLHLRVRACSRSTAAGSTSVTTTSAPSSTRWPTSQRADLADAGDGDRAAGQRRRAPGVLGRGAHALEDAVGGEHRGVAAAAVGLRAAVGVSASPGRRRPGRRCTCRRRRR